MRNTTTVSTKIPTKVSYKLSKESLLALQEIKLKPIKVDSLSDFWKDIRS